MSQKEDDFTDLIVDFGVLSGLIDLVKSGKPITPDHITAVENCFNSLHERVDDLGTNLMQARAERDALALKLRDSGDIYGNIITEAIRLVKSYQNGMLPLQVAVKRFWEQGNLLAPSIMELRGILNKTEEEIEQDTIDAVLAAMREQLQ